MIIFRGCLLLWFCLSQCTSPKDKFPDSFIRYNQASGISSLDPAFARDQANIWAVQQLFNGLYEYDPENGIRPMLAQHFELSEDGLVYTFHLRTDVFFHPQTDVNGGKPIPLKADDVVFSFQRLLDPSVASPGAWIFRDKVNSEKAFIALNDSTVQIHLTRPFRPFLSILTMPYCYVVPKEIVLKRGKSFRQRPVGTGPFLFSQWHEGQLLVLLKNPHYFEKDSQGHTLPYMDGVNVFFVESRETEFLLFKQGKIDFISGISSALKSQILQADGELQPNLKSLCSLEKSPFLNTEYLGFLLKDQNIEPESKILSKPIRQAMNYALDREEMIQYLRFGIGQPAIYGFVPPSLYTEINPPQGYMYKPDLSRKLLAEAGFPNGQGLPVISLHLNANYEDLGIYAQQKWYEVGIRVQLELTPPALQRELMAQGKVAFFRGSWIADYPDPESFFTVFYSENSAPPNYTRFQNDLFDLWYLRSLETSDAKEQQQLYFQMDSLLMAEAPIIPLYYDEATRLIRLDMEGLLPNGLNLLELKYARRIQKH